MKLRTFRIAMMSVLVILSACGSSPARQQAQQMRLAQQADVNYQEGKYAAAKKQYLTLLETNPKFATARVRLGVIAYREGDAAYARMQFEETLRIDPRNAQAKYNLAMLYLNEARTLLGDYIGAGPDTSNREPVLVLLSQLKTFGDKQ